LDDFDDRLPRDGHEALERVLCCVQDIGEVIGGDQAAEEDGGEEAMMEEQEEEEH